MEKIVLLQMLVKLFLEIMKDRDRDGILDIFDKNPDDPERK